MKYIFYLIIFFCSNDALAQTLSIMINVRSSFFKGKEDSMSLVLQNQIQERYISDAKYTKRTIYPINFNIKSKYFYKVILTDTIIESEKLHKFDMLLYEEDMGGWLVQETYTNLHYEPMLNEVLSWIFAHISVFGNVSHSINTAPKNIESDSIQTRNIVVIFEMGKGVEKKHCNTFKAIICNKYNRDQEAVLYQLNKNCNLFFYDKKTVKITAYNPIIINYTLSRKKEEYIMKQNTVGEYAQKKSDFSKEMSSKTMSLKIIDFDKYPIKNVRDLTAPSYLFMKALFDSE